MTTSHPKSLPEPAFAGGTTAITTTPVVGTPPREYAEMFVPGEEELEDGEIRVTVLGSGNPWVTRAQSSASVLLEVGNAERDLFVLDLGSGSLANYASLRCPRRVPPRSTRRSVVCPGAVRFRSAPRPLPPGLLFRPSSSCPRA
jgi:hypothetical protein